MFVADTVGLGQDAVVEDAMSAPFAALVDPTRQAIVAQLAGLTDDVV